MPTLDVVPGLKPTITRRRALALGAAAGAGSLIRSPAAGWGATAQAATSSFGLDVPRSAWARGGGRATGTLRAPKRFSLLGLRGRGLEEAGVEVRVRPRGGTWSPWTPLGVGVDHAPDRPRVAGATDPVWAGAADELQLRARRTPRGVRVHFVAVPPTPSRRRAFTRVALAAEAGAPGDGTPTGPPPIITRAQWGAGQVPPRGKPGYGEVQMAFVHHTVSANGYRPEDSASIVLAITKYHRDTNGWNDIGYNLLVDQFGQVFEGRAGGVGQAVIGAQAGGWNSISTGIATIGTFSDVAFPEAGVAALARVLAWKLSLHGAPIVGTLEAQSVGGSVNRYPRGAPVTFQRVSGHRDGCTTSCPGDSLYAQLPNLRSRAQKLAGKLEDDARLTVVPAAVAVEYGRQASFSGELRAGDGRAIGGVPVTLQKQGGTRWVTVGAGRTVSDGTWFSDVTWRRGAAVRAVAVLPGTNEEVRSAPVSVSVGYVAEVDPTARRVRAGRSAVLTGRLRPGGPVTVRVDRQVGGRWVRVGDVRARVGSNGRFRAKALLRRPGVYRLRVIGGERAKLVRAPALYVRAVRSQADVARTANGPKPLTEAVTTARESVVAPGGRAAGGLSAG